jgi:hypothetical protein
MGDLRSINTLAFLGPLEAGVLVLFAADDEAASFAPLLASPMVSPLSALLRALPLFDSESETRCTL